MTEAELRAIEARLAGASPAPWAAAGQAYSRAVADANGQTIVSSVCGPHTPHSQDRLNADLIANAPGDLAALLAEVRRLRAENEAMRLVFGDACQEPGSLGDALALALARREGRREAKGWMDLWAATRRPEGRGMTPDHRWWWESNDQPSAAFHLPPDVFCLLAAGQWYAKREMAGRAYPTREAALDDLEQALRKRAEAKP